MLHGIMGKCMRWCHNKSAGLLVLRIVLGGFFIAYGVNMFQHMDVINQLFASIGLAAPWGTIVAVAEVVAGAAILLGAFLWIAAGLITAIMAVAVWKVTGPNPQGMSFMMHFAASWGANAIYAAAAICIAFCGAGRWSLTNLYFRRRAAACRDCMASHGHGHDCPSCDHSPAK